MAKFKEPDYESLSTRAEYFCYKLLGWNRRPRPLQALTRFIQRGRRGWAKDDTWSFDCYLARVIAEGVEYLRSGHGYQNREDHWLPDGSEHECDCQVWWDTQLAEMAEGFKNWSEYNDDFTDQAALNKSLELFKEYFTGLWD